MKLEALDHPKTFDFAARLDVSRPTAIGHLELLWAFVSQKAPQGNVGKWPDGAIARACDWMGDPAKFVGALRDCGLLDADSKHRLIVHDWAEHAPRWVKLKLTKVSLPFIAGTTAPTVVDPAAPPKEPTSREAKGREAKGSQESEDARESPRGTFDDGTEHAEWETVQALYPLGAVRCDWNGAERAARLLAENGTTWQELRDAVKRYAANKKATGDRVMDPVRFFTASDRPWSQAWPIPPPKKSFAQQQQDGVMERFLGTGT